MIAPMPSEPAPSGPAPLDPTARAVIEWTCAQLINRFITAADDGDHHAVAALFARDGRFSRPSRPDEVIEGREAILAAYLARPKGKVGRHLCTNVTTAALSSERAVGRCYVTLYTGTPQAEGAWPVQADSVAWIGEYRDVFVREDGEWKILERLGSMAFRIGP